MLARLTVGFAILALLGLIPITVLAEDCGDYPLTQEQQQFIDEMPLPIQIPEGDVPVIQRCDTNADEVVDIKDIRAIGLNRNQAAAHPDDPMDLDKNGVINVFDARGCQHACSVPNCGVNTMPPTGSEQPGRAAPPGGSAPPKRTTQSARPSGNPAPLGGVVEDAACFQVVDLNGDGEDDFAGIYEHTGDDTRGGGWTLEVLILYKDDSGNIQHVTNPYSGQRSEVEGKLFQHLSQQPAGVVDLMPGSVTIDMPGVVSYRNGIPKVLYYYQDGKIKRAFYGIDD